jgi:hypothetical protein
MGSTIGVAIPYATSYLVQSKRVRTEGRVAEVARRESFYADFLRELVKGVLDAESCDRENPELALNIHHSISRMRLMSTPEVIRAAEAAADFVQSVYDSPSSGVGQFRGSVGAGPLSQLSAACRSELEGFRNR